MMTDTTPADPAAIDLERLKHLLHNYCILTSSEAEPLIAAVEALRERARAVEAKGYAAGLEAAAKLLETGWAESDSEGAGAAWFPDRKTRSAAKATRALGKEGK